MVRHKQGLRVVGYLGRIFANARRSIAVVESVLELL